jgi:hypothetical protein
MKQAVITLPHTFNTIANADPAMKGTLAIPMEALKRHNPYGGCRSRAWPVHMRRGPVADVKMNINSRLTRTRFASRRWLISVTAKRTVLAHAANMLKVDHTIRCGMYSFGSTIDIEAKKMKNDPNNSG